MAGSPVNITCRVDSFPTSNITWYLDNELLNTTLVSQETLDNTTQESTVTISSVTTMDSGTYRCEAGNLLSTVNMNTTLTVESESASYSIHTYTMFCRVHALPNATITWYFGDMMIPVSPILGVFVNGFSVIIQPDDGAQFSLLIIRPTQPSRSGTYIPLCSIVRMSEQQISVEFWGTLCVYVCTCLHLYTVCVCMYMLACVYICTISSSIYL